MKFNYNFISNGIYYIYWLISLFHINCTGYITSEGGMRMSMNSELKTVWKD